MNKRRLLGVFLALWLLVGSVPTAGAADPVAQAVAWLHTQQCSDGSFGFRRTDGSCAPSASVTADVIYVLALLGEDPAGTAWTLGGQSALDALAKLAPTYVYADAGQAGKVARAVSLAGGNPRSFGGLNLVEIIQKAYDPATGRYHPSLLYRHTLAIEGLLRAGEPVPTAAINALVRAQLPDGGWFWSFDGAQGDVDTTGRVMQLLGGQVAIERPEAFARASRFLFAKEASGGWGVSYVPGPPNANSTALAIAGLRSTGYDPQSFCFRRSSLGGVDILLTYQEASGAFVYTHQAGLEESRLMATVDAINALLQPLASSTADPICRPVYLPLVLR